MSGDPRILIVEDEAALSRPLRRYLEQEGYLVSVADTGAAARRLVQRSEFDLILLDLKMPDEDGLSLLKRFQTTLGVPVIIVSGKAKAVDRILGLELGADDYISKPFNLRELEARIKAVLTGQRRTRNRARCGTASRRCPGWSASPSGSSTWASGN